MDSQDLLQNGGSAETPDASQAENQTPDMIAEDNQDGATENLSPEEESWKRLSGQAQDRFRQVTRENNQLRNRLTQLETRVDTVSQHSSPAYNSNTVTPEVAEAVKRLSDVGVATDEKVEKVVNQRLGNLVYQMDLDRLSSRFDGTDGLPQFDKDEYEDYIARHPQYRNYSPEDVYAKMYEPEILEHKLQKLNNRPENSNTPSLKPTKTQVREEPLSPELIEQRLREPDGRAWYERNSEKINAVLAKANVETW